MPVSTRSQISGYCTQERDESAMGPRTRLKSLQERGDTDVFRNPHHGLKEKMKELTLLYEQQKLARNNLNQISRQEGTLRFGNHTNVDLLSSSRMGKHELKELKGADWPKSNTVEQIMKESVVPNSTVTRTYVLPQPRLKADDLKENIGTETEKIIGFATCPAKKAPVGPASIVRRLSMGGGGAAKNFHETSEKLEADVKEKCGSTGIHVFVRLRPMSRKEKEAGSMSCVRIVNRRDVYLTEFSNENDYLRLKRLRGRHFTFDAAFPDTTTQPEVYSTSTAELVEAVLQGKNGSVFCYGATGAGKTYTMLGTIENPGVMVLAIKDVFSKIRQRSCDGTHVVHLSYLEVYNETVRDLLSPGRPLVLREDKQGIVAAGLTQYRAYSTDEVMALLLRGNQNRTTEPTRANETSSRSHAILQVVVEYRVRDAAMNVINRVGKLSLIDLAGSERALATDQRTLRSIEGANINRSLLALSSCINALVEGKKHIPYRNSKLTQLLKDSLGGSCNTVMIANISPSNLSFGETQNTLHWADRAKEIRNKECDVNEEIVEVPESEVDQAKLLLELQKQNRELRVQLARQRQKLLSLQAQALAAQSTPTPSSLTSLLTPPTTAQVEKRRSRSSFLSAKCFTPELKGKGADDALSIKELKITVKALEAEMEKMKKVHALQMKQKDDYVKEILRRGEKLQQTREGVKRMVTRSSLRPKELITGELKSPSSRFKSPNLTAKKRSFWDITTGNSPSVSGRKTRSAFRQPLETPSAAAVPPPSMLLQPGFARKKPQGLDLKR